MSTLFKKNIPFSLFILFLVFYAVQVSSFTYKADVIAFAARSLSDFPILDYAYLHSNTLFSGESLPNYHLGHTVILWLVYNLVPNSLSLTILPSGFLSAICASLVVMLTYLIWIQLNIPKRSAVFIAIVFGLIPTFWEHGTIGEIHSLQMLFILLFIYTFLKEKYIVSTIAFLIANLISPLSGLAIGFIFLKGFNKTNFRNGFLIAISALVIYIMIFSFIGADFFRLLNPGNHQPSGRGIIYRLAVLFVFIIINLNFFLYYLAKGIHKSYSEKSKILFPLFIAIMPQILLIFISSGFFIEYGSFQHLLFWAIAFPIGYYLSSIKLKSIYFIFSLIFSIALTISLFLTPHSAIGKSLSNAGNWLNGNGQTEKCIIGPWNAGINLIHARNGSGVEYFNKYYYDIPYPSDSNLVKLNLDDCLIVKPKKISIREILAKTNIPGLAVEDYCPTKTITIGTHSKIFENNFVEIFVWEK